jgi:hypothetical protein
MRWLQGTVDSTARGICSTAVFVRRDHFFKGTIAFLAQSLIQIAAY